VPLTKAEIAHLIPHSGAMCLLDEIVSWTQSGIRASTCSHHDEQNPLRHRGHLPGVCAVEYAAQAMAVHGALAGINTERPRSGYLVSARDVAWQGRHLDDFEGNLIIDAERLMGDARGAVYRFSIQHRARQVSSGTLMVVLDAQRVTP
jgi:predicted hotdog family 3-hydroxylacyl-ACP dehydratase